MKKCPFCGSTRLGHIIYGLPDYTEELIRRIDNEEVYMGGCLIMEGYPENHCYACGQNVGKRPAFYTRRGEKRNGTLLYTIRPVEEALRYQVQQQLKKAEEEQERRRIQRKLEERGLWSQNTQGRK